MQRPENLKVIPLFAGFDDDEINAFIAAANRKTLPPDHVFFAMGKVNSSLFIIRRGSVRIDRLGTSDAIPLASLEASQTFGEMSFLDASRTTAAVTAGELVEVYEISREAVDKLLTEKPKIGLKLWKNIAHMLKQRLTKANEVIDQYTDIKQLLLQDQSLREYYSRFCAVVARRIWIALTVIFLLTSGASAAEEKLVSFAVGGKPLMQMSLAEIRQKVPVTEITVWEPHEDKTVTYEGFEIGKIFAAVYGDRWKEIDEVLFTCVDGYQPVVPMGRFNQHTGYLVYRRLDQDAFIVQNRFQAEKDVPLGPFYLVWDNLHSKELREDGANGWPYQVVGVDLVNFADRFPRLSPPKDASEKAKAGFLAFRENCMACHTVNGEGGNKAPELNYPMSVTEYLSGKWLRQWLKDPRSIRYNSTMPGFAAHEKPDAFVDDILAYLKTMAQHKQKPQ
jgi:CRP-like cAMP-binding protein/mono/diheme cytochrome c family protein